MEFPAEIRDALTNEFYAPRPQSYWTHEGTQWTEVSPSSPSPPPATSAPLKPGVLRLISWNIDVLGPFGEARMRAALTYLETLVSSVPAPIPIILFLQEMDVSDLIQIREAAWVQQRFYLTDLEPVNWESDVYGTVTLVDKRLSIERVWRVRWYSEFERDGLFVDVHLSSDSAGEDGDGREMGKALRLCNTHLESLIADPPVRPVQLSVASKYLHEAKAAAALLAGDLNAIQPFDRTLHTENGLCDAYLERGGKEDEDEGFTWGYQSGEEARKRFGCSRMDKILFRGDIKVATFERIGIAVRVEGKKGEEMREAGGEEWVTDHYGVMGDFELRGWRFADDRS